MSSAFVRLYVAFCFGILPKVCSFCFFGGMFLLPRVRSFCFFGGIVWCGFCVPRWRSVDYVAQVAGFVAQVAGFVAQVAGFLAQVAVVCGLVGSWGKAPRGLGEEERFV